MKAFLIPKAGVTVKYPGSKKALPATGAEVTLDTYWYRRLRDADVTEGKAPAPAVATPAAPAAPAAEAAPEVAADAVAEPAATAKPSAAAKGATRIEK